MIYNKVIVSGNSMTPTLYNGDVIIIAPSAQYFVGDILVFKYKGQLIVHRLIQINGRYFCKGDNSFRMEDIEYSEILGKVIGKKDQTIQQWVPWKIELSHLINKVFRKCRYNVQLTKETDLFKAYCTLVLNKNNNVRFKLRKDFLLHVEHTKRENVNIEEIYPLIVEQLKNPIEYHSLLYALNKGRVCPIPPEVIKMILGIGILNDALLLL